MNCKISLLVLCLVSQLFDTFAIILVGELLFCFKMSFCSHIQCVENNVLENVCISKLEMQ